MSALPAARPGRWLLRRPAEESAARLFCLPYSGCGASMYRLWPWFLDTVEVCPVQFPGRENRLREPPYKTYEELAVDLVAALRPYVDRPFGFFGHCGSALAGYQACVELASTNQPLPTWLFVSSQVAPHEGPYGRYLHMDDAELAEDLSGLVRRLGGEPQPDLLALSVRVLRADVEMNKRYRMASPTRLHCPITALGWEDDFDVSPAQMRGWADCGDTTFVTLPGGHYSFLDCPPVLRTALANAFRPGPEASGG